MKIEDLILLYKVVVIDAYTGEKIVVQIGMFIEVLVIKFGYVIREKRV